MRTEELARRRDGADAVAVSVKSNPEISPLGEDCSLQHVNVRRDRLWMHAAEGRIRAVPNLNHIVSGGA